MKNMHSNLLGIFSFLLICLSIYCCGDYDDMNKDLYGAKYTVEQKEIIAELAKKYGIEFKFSENPQGKLETIEELESMFKSISSINETYEVPLQIFVASKEDGLLLNTPRTRAGETETGTDNCTCNYSLVNGDKITFRINASWSIISMGDPGTPGVPHCSLSLTASVESYDSKHGFKYSAYTDNVTDPSLSDDKKTLSARCFLFVSGSAGVAKITLTLNATVDLANKKLSASIS